MVVSVFFRSPERQITIWNALYFSASSGIFLHIFDSSGHETRVRYPLISIDPSPPDASGRGALISIGGRSFAGFDDRIPAKFLFPGPGRYTIKCEYMQTLSRNYFVGNSIWGKEDGAIESPGAIVDVSEK
jgi:hypothetical protein